MLLDAKAVRKSKQQIYLFMAVGEPWPNEAGLDQNQNNWIQRLSSLFLRIWGSSYPWALISREVWLNATGSPGVLCLEAGDAWFAAHRVELPVLTDTKEIFISTQKRRVGSSSSLWISLELRRGRGTGTSFFYLGFLLWWAPAGRLIAHCHHWLITCQAGGAGVEFSMH